MVRNHRNSVFTLSFFASLMMLGLAAPARADSCQPVFDALKKVVSTSSHTYTTHTASFVNGGKPRESETIYVQGKIYIRANGKWMHSPATPEEVLEQAKENEERGKASCRFVRNELVGTESAAVYSMHREIEDSREDAQMWISRRTGLPLRDEQDLDAGGKAGKEHRSTRFEYSNIRPPL